MDEDRLKEELEDSDLESTVVGELWKKGIPILASVGLMVNILGCYLPKVDFPYAAAPKAVYTQYFRIPKESSDCSKARGGVRPIVTEADHIEYEEELKLIYQKRWEHEARQGPDYWWGSAPWP
jgi:hypothetical protein